jgi:hypothetical protein
MQAPAAQALLQVWERGSQLSPTQRALALLETAMPASAAELAALPVGVRDTALLRLRAALFGDTLAAVAQCPQCRADLDVACSAAALCAQRPVGSALAFRLPTSDDVMAAQSARALALRCAPDLPEEAQDDLADAICALDPQAQIELALRCPACEHDWLELLDIASFLWTEVGSLARRLLGDVHVLALSYGWREADILAMSAARRRHYLDLVQA